MVLHEQMAAGFSLPHRHWLEGFPARGGGSHVDSRGHRKRAGHQGGGGQPGEEFEKYYGEWREQALEETKNVDTGGDNIIYDVANSDPDRIEIWENGAVHIIGTLISTEPGYVIPLEEFVENI